MSWLSSSPSIHIFFFVQMLSLPMFNAQRIVSQTVAQLERFFYRGFVPTVGPNNQPSQFAIFDSKDAESCPFRCRLELSFRRRLELK